MCPDYQELKCGEVEWWFNETVGQAIECAPGDIFTQYSWDEPLPHSHAVYGISEQEDCLTEDCEGSIQIKKTS